MVLLGLPVILLEVAEEEAHLLLVQLGLLLETAVTELLRLSLAHP
jgi:hypothetical protein